MKNKFWAPQTEVLAYLENIIPPNSKVLEIGPGACPFSKATHFVVRPGSTLQLSGTIIEADVSKDRLPFADKEFDFIYCRHVVEDLCNPFNLIQEMNRIGKAGYVETPSPMCELNKNVDGFGLDYRGYIHHRWIVWSEGSILNAVEKATVVECLNFDATPLLEIEPFLWNTHHLWTDELKFHHFQHDVDFLLQTTYAPLLKHAVVSGQIASKAMKERCSDKESTDGGGAG